MANRGHKERECKHKARKRENIFSSAFASCDWKQNKHKFIQKINMTVLQLYVRFQSFLLYINAIAYDIYPVTYSHKMAAFHCNFQGGPINSGLTVCTYVCTYGER